MNSFRGHIQLSGCLLLGSLRGSGVPVINGEYFRCIDKITGAAFRPDSDFFSIREMDHGTHLELLFLGK
jgi:hypothetical protein